VKLVDGQDVVETVRQWIVLVVGLALVGMYVWSMGKLAKTYRGFLTFDPIVMGMIAI